MHLAVQLLGTPQFQLDRLPVAAGRRAVVALLAYLTVVNAEHPNRRHARESLAALLWANYGQAKALSNLRHTLWEVSQFIGDGWIIPEHETVYLAPEAEVTLDVAQFRSLMDRASQEQNQTNRISLLVDAANLYRGDFLEGFTLKDAPNFNEWTLAQAENLRHSFASVLKSLVEEYSAFDQILAAIAYAQRLISLDPIHEAAHRKLMELYARSDQRAAAIQQYQALENLLRKELNLDPQLETRELYKRIRRGEFRPISMENEILRQDISSPRHNLPFHLTTFIGRENERVQIRRLLAEHRLVTLIGAGGIGKTRLSIEIGQSLLDNFSDGVWFIPLESLTDEDLVPETVASLLDIAEPANQPVLEALINHLESRTLLLVLDNCEHLLDACAELVAALLENCPKIKILITSREALRWEGEVIYPVPPLAVPENRKEKSSDDPSHYESVQLFIARATLVTPSLKVTDANISLIVDICSRLDGIPLAIELAAAYVDIFTTEEIVDQLRHSFDLLVSNARSAIARHQTMRTSIDWGWNLLTEAERVFLRQVSVFIGGWTLRAAEKIGLIDTRDLTGSLVKKSFVISQQEAKRETRFGLHEVIRSFAQEKLAEAGEEQMIRNRHLEYFLELSRQFEPALHGIDQDLWLERLFVERDNIRAALAWAAKTNIQAGLYLANRLRTLWENYDLRDEARWILTI